MPEPMSGCWLWVGQWNWQTYGVYRPPVVEESSRRKFTAHRYLYRKLVGPVPDGYELDHLCRVRSCVNPRHLELVTHRVNILRGDTFAAAAAAKTHCPRGHLLAGDNLTSRSSRRGRECRLCHNLLRRKVVDP